MQRLKAKGEDPQLPPVSACLFEDPAVPFGQPLLVEWLMEVGPTEAAGMGPVVITWSTLEAWSSRTAIDLAPWQARLLRRLSRDWLSETERARDPQAPAPWVEAPPERNWEAMEKRLEELFDKLR